MLAFVEAFAEASVERSWVPEAVELLPLEPLLHNIEDRARDPCRLWSRRDRSIFRICYRRRLLEDWGGRSIGLVREL